MRKPDRVGNLNSRWVEIGRLTAFSRVSPDRWEHSSLTVCQTCTKDLEMVHGRAMAIYLRLKALRVASMARWRKRVYAPSVG